MSKKEQFSAFFHGLEINLKQLESFSTQDLSNARRAEDEKRDSFRATKKFAYGFAVVMGLSGAGLVGVDIKNDKPVGAIAGGAFGVAIAGVAVGLAKRRQEEDAEKNIRQLDRAVAMRGNFENRAAAGSWIMYNETFDGLIREGYISESSKLEYKAS